MKNRPFELKNHCWVSSKLIKRVLTFCILQLSFLLLFGCSQDPTLNKLNVGGDKNIYATPSIGVTPSSIYSSTNQSTLIPTSTLDPSKLLQITISATNGPIQIISKNSESGYLYKNTVVTLTLVDLPEAVNYLNLDDLSENGEQTSDIEISRSFGSEGEYFYIHPVNNAYYFYLNQVSVDKDSCIKHFPISGFTSVTYLLQGNHFISGNSYCILTNEGNIAVVNYVKDSKKHTQLSESAEDLSVKVIVFNK